ncbi:MAG: DUF4136 domain-containing protein [Gammaproteobacteria bacterium]
MTNRFKIIISFVLLIIVSGCNTTPFLDVNARDSFELVDGASFSVTTNKADLPANIDPISVEIAAEEAARYFSSLGYVVGEKNTKYLLDLTVSTKDKLRLDDYRFRPYYYGWGRPYDFDRVSSFPEYFLRISLIDNDNSTTLWTGLTKWRGRSLSGNLELDDIKESVNYILDQL